MHIIFCYLSVHNGFIKTSEVKNQPGLTWQSRYFSFKVGAVLLLFVLTFSALHAQEICDNGIDDNGNGLIDLNDTTACACSGLSVEIEVPSLIPNPSFEDITCCPNGLSQLNCAEEWIQASSPTTDLMNTCDFVVSAVESAGLLPFPDGEGAIGAIYNEGWKEYVGACLSDPMEEGLEYQLTFQIASAPMTNSGFTCLNNVGIFYSGVEVVLYGNTVCDNLPWTGTNCPTISSDGWEILGSVYYDPIMQWSTVSINFFPSEDIYAVALGPPCVLPDSYEYVGPGSCRPYFIYDNLLMNETSFFDPITINKTGSDCTDNVALTGVNPLPDSEFQWYLDGIALIGETDPTIEVTANGYGYGLYSLRVSFNGLCEVVDFLLEESIFEADFTFEGYCAESDIEFSNETVADLPFDSEWNFGDNSPVSNEVNPDHTYNSAGIFEVQLDVSAGECESTQILEIEILPIPEVSVNGTFGCQGDTVQLNSDTGTGNLIYSWSGPDNFSSSEANPMIQNVDQNNQGVYSLTVTDTSGCSNSDEAMFNVYGIFSAEVDYEICSNDTLVLADGTTVSETGTYTITFQSELTGCDSTVIANVVVQPAYFSSLEVTLCEGESFEMPDGNIVSSAGTYESALTTENGCDSIIQVLLNLNPLPNLSWNIQPQYCYYDDAAILNVQPAGGVLEGDNVSGADLDLSGTGPGNYSVSYQYTDGNGCSNSLEANYIVSPPVFPMFEHSTYCNTATFTNLTVDPQENFSYHWQLGDNTLSTEYSFAYSINEPNTDIMTLIVSDQYDCTYQVSQAVELQSALDLTGFFIPNIITPNGDDHNDRLELGVENVECLEYRIVIMDRWGKQVYEMTDNTLPFSGVSASGQELKEGVYFYHFESPQIDCTSLDFQPFCTGSITIVR